MATPDDVKMGRIIKYDSRMKAGYIARDEDGEHLYFTYDDVLKDVGLGNPMEDHRVQFVEEQDPSTQKPIAKNVTILSRTLTKSFL